MAPARISDRSLSRIPRRIGWPKPPAPMMAPNVAKPTFCTADVRIPARIVGSAIGSSISTSRGDGAQAQHGGRFDRAALDAVEARVGVSHDRQQAITKQRRHGRDRSFANAAITERRNQRQQQHQQGQRRNRLQQSDRGQHHPAGSRTPLAEDAQRDPDDDRRQQRTSHQVEMLEHVPHRSSAFASRFARRRAARLCRLRNSAAACASVVRPASTSSLSDCIVDSDSVPSNRRMAVSMAG